MIVKDDYVHLIWYGAHDDGKSIYFYFLIHSQNVKSCDYSWSPQNDDEFVELLTMCHVLL